MPFTMRERVEPRKVDFNEPGVKVAGVLESVRSQVLDGKAALRFTVDCGEGKRVFFFGTHQLTEKLSARDAGHFIDVTYIGKDTSVSKNGNSMSVFEVLISDETAGEVEPLLF